MKTDDIRWRAVQSRDGARDGEFVYAVASTGIYCRPSCPSRRPGRGQVTFFPVPEAAEAAGYRACRRCKPRDVPVDSAVEAVRAACRAIAETDAEDGLPTLAHLGSLVGLSPTHLQRTFRRVMGISPRDYAAALRTQRFRAGVRDGETVTQALYGAGYGSSSRLYESAARDLGMTPASYARGGRGAEITFAIVESPFGRILVAGTAVGICMVSLGDDDARLEAELRGDYPEARIHRDDGAMAHWVAGVLASLDGPCETLPFDLRATAFQIRVWRELAAIPRGETRTYAQIAAALGQPKAARAVGRACATNPVSIVVPCHRAVGSDGKLHGYRWGLPIKRALLDHEGGD
ncbi:MAG: bifunctional DNA-binding transcriptional regulator/O6-methylguanine-DNA methyltransferase Ada [Rhodobacterales bacterium]|nr:bifunctional DNA-binding transcriptional regulator/O6-methylguanine-DNA methyltransferase Ada [Rhodobacterales bacterium]